VAYASNESGRMEVYVRPFPGPGGGRRISSGRGGGPRWRRDGRELYYLAADGKLMAVEVQEAPALRTGTARAIGEARGGALIGLGFADYDVSPDGQRFLVRVPVRKEAAPPLTLVLNWVGELAR